MPNDFTSNPIVLDTFTAAINVGLLAFGDSKKIFKLNSIEWQTPTVADHVAVVTDGEGKPIFAETCTTPKQSIIKYFHGQSVSGIRIGANGVGSGKIVICYF